MTSRKHFKHYIPYISMEKLRVGDIMKRGVIALSSTDTVYDAARLMSRNNIGSVIVLSRGKAVGIVTERDIVRRVIGKGKNSKKTKLGRVMSKPLRVVSARSLIEDAVNAMRKYNIRKLPVVNDKNVVIGIVTDTDIITIYPEYLTLVRESAYIASEKMPLTTEEWTKTHITGTCEECGAYSTDLRFVRGKLLCKECADEVE